MKYWMIGLAAVLCGCQSNVEYQRIGYGPELQVADAQCNLMAMSAQQGYVAWGSDAYLAGAAIGNAIGNAITMAAVKKNCMVIQGWGEKPKARKSYTVNGMRRKVDPQLAKRAYQERKAREEQELGKKIAQQVAD